MEYIETLQSDFDTIATWIKTNYSQAITRSNTRKIEVLPTTLKPFNGYITIDKGKVYFEYGMIGEMGNNSIYDIEEHVWVKDKGMGRENIMEDFLMDWEQYKPDLKAKLQGLENIKSFEIQ